MRGVVAAGSAVVLLLAGCGGGDDDEAQGTSRAAPAAVSSTPPPSPTPQPLVFGEGVRSELTSGAIAVVDLGNRVSVEPSAMSINREQTLSGLRWRGWGGSTATAAGEVETLVCDPSCALGKLEHSRATLKLSAPRRCGGRRFYAKASMSYEEEGTGRTRAPAGYLRTPC
jgi:hypothetical protein